jgi:hypothetical protein
VAISFFEKDTAPKWVHSLEPVFLTYIKNMGDGAIHPNDGGIQQQSEIDSELLSKIKIVMAALLYHVYEAPKKNEEFRTAFQAKPDPDPP